MSQSQQTQQVKKPAGNPAQAAKMSAAAQKMSGAAYSAAESTKSAAQNVVNIGAGAMRDMLYSGSGEAQKAQEKMWEMGREGVEHFSRATDMWTRMCMELMGICRDNVEAAIECANITAGVAKNVSAEISETCNKSFSEAVEMSKEAFNCRTINDVTELQSKAVRQALDTCFNETNRLSNMVFECATEALEPINERVCEASDRLCKVMAA